MDVHEPNGTVCRNLGSDRLLSALHVHKWMQLGSWSADPTHWARYSACAAEWIDCDCDDLEMGTLRRIDESIAANGVRNAVVMAL